MLTDGDENWHPLIKDIRNDVLAKSVIVHSILYTAATDPGTHHLSKLARETGGNDHFQTGDDQTELFESFRVVFECDPNEKGVVCSNATRASSQFYFTVY